MEVIEFRGISIDNGEWVYGSLINNIVALTGEYKINGQITKDNATPFMAIVNEVGCVYEVIPETVGQYIGKEDKNFKKIYDGDNIKFLYDGEYLIRTVVYDNEWNRFCVWYNGATSFGVNMHLSKDFEVIGYVHDIKDLLEVINAKN